MTILLDETTKVVVQGITGPMGRFQVEEMLRAGTRVVGGVSPGKGGEIVHGVPVFDTVSGAGRSTGAEMSILFVAAPRVKDAIYESIDAGIQKIVCVAEFLPVHDLIQIKRKVRDTKTLLIGPNCSGLMSPGKAKVGFYCDDICIPGDVGVMSKSGTLSYVILLEMKRYGIGVSTVIGVGGDEAKGITFRDCIEMFEADPNTRSMVIVGEVGGRDEEEAALFIREHSRKPVVAFISGRTIPQGRSIGHAGAMVVGKKGNYLAKIDALKSAGVLVAETVEDIPILLRKCHG